MTKTASMAFDPFKRRPINSRPHVVAPGLTGQESHCINCGATGWDIILSPGGCDPDSDAAKKFRREQSDIMVGRVTGDSTRR